LVLLAHPPLTQTPSAREEVSKHWLFSAVFASAQSYAYVSPSANHSKWHVCYQLWSLRRWL